MKPILGVGGWVWHTSTFVNDVDKIIKTGIDYVLLKVNDGDTSFNSGDELRTICSKLTAANIRIFGWGYVRPDTMESSAKLAAIRCKALNLEYYSLDFEIEFENISYAKAVSAANNFIKTWKSEAPNIGLLGSSFYLPELHPNIPYDAFLKGCAYWQPQVYWENNTPSTTVQKAIKSGSVLKKPMIITLPSYDMSSEGGKMPSIKNMVTACDTAFKLGAKAVDFFSLDESIVSPALLTGITSSAKKHSAKTKNISK